MKLSIITINYNNAEGLRKTMESVLAQTCKKFEYIVVDGASSDDSVNVIKELESEGIRELENFHWISEKDTGIYNAMNKGVKMCHGEYTLMLNSGDYFVDEHVIERIMPELDGADIVQGNNIEERDGNVYRNRGYGKSDLDVFDIMKGFFLHQASFCRRDLFDRFGYFDESYRIAGDTKFFMNSLGVHNATFRYVDIDVTNFDCNGISAHPFYNWNDPTTSEYRRIMSELFPSRMYEFMVENDKKVRLYNYLHKHAWVWNCVMAVTHIANLFYKSQQDRVIERIN